MKSVDEQRRYAGPVRERPLARPTRYGRCRRDLTPSDLARHAWLCTPGADPDGYTARLEKAQREARRCTLEAYPVCRNGGATLPQSFVDAGRNAHDWREGKCQPPGPEDGPLARRRSA